MVDSNINMHNNRISSQITTPSSPAYTVNSDVIIPCYNINVLHDTINHNEQTKLRQPHNSITCLDLFCCYCCCRYINSTNTIEPSNDCCSSCCDCDCNCDDDDD